MAWFAELAGKAESLLNNLDEQTGVALRNHNGVKKKNDRSVSPLHPESPAWNSKRRPIRNTRKAPHVTETKSNSYSPTKKVAQNSRKSRSQTKETNDYLKETVTCTRSTNRSPARPPPLYDLNNCPDTLVGDLKNNDPIDHFGLKHRRFSLPGDLEAVRQDDYTIKMQNLEVENAMLKNELNVMNREVSELLDRLRKTEDGNDVVSDEDLQKTSAMLESTEIVNKTVNADKESLASQLDLLKKMVNNLASVEIARHKDQNKSLELEVNLLQGRNKELEDLIRQLNEKYTEHETNQSKIDNELRHAQTTISDLEGNLERATAECRRLEGDWDAYKHRVKSMLFAKDKEIKELQEGFNLTEDTKILIEQIDSLKEEREELSEAISIVRGECAEMRQHMEQLEARRGTAERAVAALREALRDERAARGRADSHANSLVKELKYLQMETDQTIASLRSTIRDKDTEISRLREASIHSSDSALNVADYVEVQDSIDKDKIQYLTQTLVQRQGKIDSLLADNNMLRIQLEKLESKYMCEVSTLRAQNQSHSVVQVQDDSRRRPRPTDSVLTSFSRRIGNTFKRYPVMRMFMLFYMMGLHFWVLTVLFTSTPESYINISKTKKHSD